MMSHGTQTTVGILAYIQYALGNLRLGGFQVEGLAPIPGYCPAVGLTIRPGYVPEFARFREGGEGVRDEATHRLDGGGGSGGHKGPNGELREIAQKAQELTNALWKMANDRERKEENPLPITPGREGDE